MFTLIDSPEYKTRESYMTAISLINELRTPNNEVAFAETCNGVPFTPLILMEEVWKAISKLMKLTTSTRICVFYTLEFAVFLASKGYTDITVVTLTVDPTIEDFLKEFDEYSHIKYHVLNEVNKNMIFDVVIGNPPYQGQRETDPPLWPVIVGRAIEIVKEGGVIAMITPPGWMQPRKNSKIDYTFFYTHQITQVHVFDAQTGAIHFPGVGQKICWYIIEKRDVSDPTKLIQYNAGKVAFSIDFKFRFSRSLPTTFSPLDLSINAKVTNGKAAFSGKRDCEFHSQKIKKAGIVSDIATTEFKHKCYVSARLIRYTSQAASHFASWKLMVGGQNLIKQAFIDKDCSVCEDIAYIKLPSEEQAKNCLAAFNSKLFLYLDKVYRSGKNLTHGDIFPHLDWSIKWTDAAIYEHFELTPGEITHIEGIIG